MSLVAASTSAVPSASSLALAWAGLRRFHPNSRAPVVRHSRSRRPGALFRARGEIIAHSFLKDLRTVFPVDPRMTFQRRLGSIVRNSKQTMFEIVAEIVKKREFRFISEHPPGRKGHFQVDWNQWRSTRIHLSKILDPVAQVRFIRLLLPRNQEVFSLVGADRHAVAVTTRHVAELRAHHSTR
ncbi:hypothetical protein ABZ725_43250 [Streptomyces sp. NPDC006872]|uniref:hypothetical protein n=1 Tax=Streptomyces sp. NPDC006872 TaxID=3155720 RepID=UPI0033CADA02